MDIVSQLPKIGVGAFVVLGAGLVGWKMFASGATDAHLDVQMPELSGQAVAGQKVFQKNCASCHGDNASGSDKGPPLIHNIYNPGHHADGSFFMAARKGVRAHHWPYGNMPAQPQVTDKQVADIVRFVREVQAENGINYKAHKM